MTPALQKQTPWQAVNERRLLPVLAAYFGLMWALVEVSGFLVERYGLPDHLIDACFLAMWVFLPLVVLLGWKIGEPGPAIWSRREVVLSSTLGTLALAALALQASWPRSVEVEPATDSIDTASVIDINQRITSLVIFPFAIDSDDPADGWLGDGLAELAKYDLDHDARFSVTTAMSTGPDGMLAVVRRLGAADLESAPLSIRRQAARTSGTRALATGKAARVGSGWRIELELHRLSPDSVSGPFTLLADDPWQAIDRIAATIRSELAPIAAESPANDPSIRSVTSDSLDALSQFVAGSRALYFRDYPTAAAAFEQATTLDPGLVLAAYFRAVALAWKGEQQAAEAELARIEPRLAALPPRWRYQIQSFIRQRAGDRDGERRVFEVWVSEMPNDLSARMQLAELEVGRNPDDNAAWARLRGLAIESGSADMLRRLSARLQARGELEQALQAARLARDRDPTFMPSLMLLADIEHSRGQFDAAREHLEAARIMRTELVNPLLTLADIEFDQGSADAAMQWLDQVADRRLDPLQRRGLSEGRIALLQKQGRLRAASVELDALIEMQRSTAGPPAQLSADVLRYVGLQAQLSGADAARAWAHGLIAAAEGALSEAQAAGIDLMIARTLKDGALLQQANRRLVELAQNGRPIDESSSSMYAMYAALASGWSEPGAQGMADLQLARDQLRRQAVRRGSASYLSQFDLAAVMLALDAGDASSAGRWLADAARRAPGDPAIQFAQARLAVLQQDQQRARTLLDLALQGWAEADPEFRPAQQARDLRATL